MITSGGKTLACFFCEPEEYDKSGEARLVACSKCATDINKVKSALVKIRKEAKRAGHNGEKQTEGVQLELLPPKEL